MEDQELVGPWVEEEDDLDLMEDRLNGVSSWELAFEMGEAQANAEMLDGWEEDDWD